MTNEEILQKLEEEIHLRGFSPHTHEEYMLRVKSFGEVTITNTRYLFFKYNMCSSHQYKSYLSFHLNSILLLVFFLV